jgi:hypothetical protein
LIDVEKRLTFNEYKRGKDKKKVRKIMDDIYEENVAEPDSTTLQTEDPIPNEIENKLKEIVENPEEPEQKPIISQSFGLKSRRRK